MSQLISTILWYLLLAGLGWLAFPISYRFLRALPDRGYAFARPLGLLLWGFIFWLLSNYGLLHNSIGGLLTAALSLAGLSWWAWRQTSAGEMRAWLREHRSLVFAVEGLFLLAFAFMLVVRLANPEIEHTEQPMELAFINAILRSPGMPPHDPWLSGYSISYYYFGYLLTAMLAKLSGVIGSVAFNLSFVTVFASAAAGAYGLAYNLLSIYRPAARRSALWFAALAPLFVLVTGNLVGVLEIAHARHALWVPDATGRLSSGFWSWLDIDELSNPPTAEPQWAPRNYGSGFWWWWRSSRVINDYTLSGGDQELIDEFPAFSFTLGDLHPHVLSMPFVMLAMGLALNAYQGGATKRELHEYALSVGGQRFSLLNLPLSPIDALFAAVLLGALAFINIWDLPIYIGLFALALLLRSVQVKGWSWELAGDFLVTVITFILAGYILYFPFYVSFTSQAAGILPNLINPSRGVHLWVMFGTFFALIFVYLLHLWRRQASWSRLAISTVYGFVFVAGLWAFSLLTSWVYVTFMSNSIGQAISGLGAQDFGSLLAVSLQRRLAAAGGWITLALLLGLSFGLVLALSGKQKQIKAEAASRGAHVFVLLLVLTGALLATAPEFIYLRDQFGTRMNTVFKFFFQTWQMWGVAAAVIVAMLLYEARGLWRAGFALLVAVVIVAGLVFPAYSFTDITRDSKNSLDGAVRWSADEVRAFEWLRQAPLGTVAEAVGGSYDASYARFSAHSGQPTLIGWPGHEGQWRGGNVDWSRITDVQTLYESSDWAITQAIIEKYDIRYIVLSQVERATYVVNQAQFDENLQLAFSAESVTIYQVP
jgi:YYY domain-containing protein